MRKRSFLLATISVLGIFIAGCGPLEVGKGEVPKGTKEEIPAGTKGEVPTGTKGEVPTGTKGEVPTGTKGEVPTGTKGEVPTETNKPLNGGDVENGKIAFESTRDGYDVHLINADGSEQTNLTDDDRGSAQEPVWSPDGTRIAFESSRDGNFEVHVMKADGSEQINLSKNRATDSKPVWSPDGTRIAFVSDRDGNSEVYVMNALDGSEQTNLSKNPGDDEGPVFSPDGTRIAFERNRDIFVMNALDGSEQTNLTNDSRYNTKLAFSPDGTKIAFESQRRGGFSGISTVDADGTGTPTSLTTSRANDETPVFSPDSTKIAFESDRDDNWQVYVMNALDGSEQTNLSNDPESREWGPVWSPDGAKIAFVRRDSGYSELYTMDAGGSSKTALTYSSDYNDNPSWQPVGGTPTDVCAPRTGQRQPEQSQISISATTAGWQETSLTNLQQGDRFEVRYSEGDWSVDCRSFPYVGPEGYTPDIDEQIYQGCRLVESLPYGTLLGKVGNGSIFAVGEGDELTADASGALYLRINDDDACLVDNDGELILDEPERVTQEPDVPPAAPSNLSVEAVDSSSIRLEWVDNSDDEDGFEISNGETGTTVGADAKTYTWKGLELGTYMCFEVRAFNSSGGNSAFTPVDSPYYKCATTPGTGTKTTVVSVPSDQPWTDTGLDLAAGSSVTIAAGGTIKIAGSDPGKTPDGSSQDCIPPERTEDEATNDFIAPALPCWALIGRIGNGEPFEVGTSKTLSVPTAGRLYLGVNDGRADFGDNSGEWVAEITVSGK